MDQLSAGRIRRAFADQILTADTSRVVAQAEEMGGLLEGDLGTLALLAAAGGALALALRQGRRGAAALLVAFVASDFLYSIWINPMGMADRQDGTPSAIGLAILAGVGVAAAARIFARAAPFAAGALAVFASVQPVLAHGGDKLAAAGSESPRAWAEAALRRCAPRAVVMTKSDSMSAELIWLTIAEADRPDVAVLARQHLFDRVRATAVLGADPGDSTWRAIVASGRPIDWEPVDDAPPPGFAFDIPIGAVGPAASGVDPRRSIADAERIFAPPATDDEVTRGVAQRAFANLGVEAAGMGDHADAAEVTERAIALDDVPRSRVNAARYRLAMRDEPAARVHVETALAEDPDNAAAWSILGVLDARAGKCADAKKDFNRALAIDPNEPDARSNAPLVDTKCK